MLSRSRFARLYHLHNPISSQMSENEAEHMNIRMYTQKEYLQYLKTNRLETAAHTHTI
jgi:hypothetical protein